MLRLRESPLTMTVTDSAYRARCIVGLPRRVARTDDEDLSALHRPCLGARGAVEDALADEILQRRDAEPAPGHPCREDDSASGDLTPRTRRSPRGSDLAVPRLTTDWDSTNRVPNNQACSTARLARSSPLTPRWNPR